MRRAILALFAAVFLWRIYLAATTAITMEEAVSYNHFASQPILTIFTAPYDRANQVLQSLLCSLVLRFMRVTEFSIRVASLIGLIVYFWAALRLLSPKTWPGFAGLFILAVNPFTLAWLPDSTGIWMAAGLLLFAIRELLDDRLAAAGICLGVSVCFNIGFVLPSLGLIFLYLYIESWGRPRWGALIAINSLLLSPAIVCFAFWILPWVNAAPGTFQWANFAPFPTRFRAGPERALPGIARSLRDELRKSPPRPVRVAINPLLIEPLEFYRRRYALGAIQKIVPLGGTQPVDYSIVLDDVTGTLNLAKGNHVGGFPPPGTQQ